LANETAEMYK